MAGLSAANQQHHVRLQENGTRKLKSRETTQMIPVCKHLQGSLIDLVRFGSGSKRLAYEEEACIGLENVNQTIIVYLFSVNLHLYLLLLSSKSLRLEVSVLARVYTINHLSSHLVSKISPSTPLQEPPPRQERSIIIQNMSHPISVVSDSFGIQYSNRSTSVLIQPLV